MKTLSSQEVDKISIAKFDPDKLKDAKVSFNFLKENVLKMKRNEGKKQWMTSNFASLR